MSIFRVGEVYSVDGRTICIKVDKDKNLSYLMYQGELIKNVSVGNYIKILKGFIQLVAKVESESIRENKNLVEQYHYKAEEIDRFLTVKLIGYFENGHYHKGVKELPLIGNACQLMDNKEFAQIHRFANKDELSLRIGCLMTDEMIPIELGINKLFASHIGIFGNTGSGKSYTLANLYKKIFDLVGSNNKFKKNARFLLFDFNGEYSGEDVIISKKKSYVLSTRENNNDNKIPLKKDDLLNPELFFILSNATEKTQQPFIKRALGFYSSVQKKEYPLNYIKTVLHKLIESVVCMADYIKAKLLLDYFSEILPPRKDENGYEIGLLSDLNWHGSKSTFYTDKDGALRYFNSDGGKTYIKQLEIYNAVDNYTEGSDFINTIINYLYVQLIKDVLNNRAINDHIAPAINKLKSLNRDFGKVFVIDDSIDFWGDNIFIVVDMNRVNLNMKKLVPLLLSYKLYSEHKSYKSNEVKKSLNIIVDEAHNVLSYDSLRESESWKDFRLETFEEIIKEGRKFGVFMTIASQRPSDISPTIISQLHNYFIHRLVNNRDLEMIERAVSYLDKISLESLPILPVGACVLSGIIADVPVIIQVDQLEKGSEPQSGNISLLNNWLDIANSINSENHL